jgi:hypothetical protein
LVLLVRQVPVVEVVTAEILFSPRLLQQVVAVVEATI